MKPNCTTHHFACECREERFRELEKENELLKLALKESSDALKEAVDMVKYMPHSSSCWQSIGVNKDCDCIVRRAREFLQRHKDKIKVGE